MIQTEHKVQYGNNLGGNNLNLNKNTTQLTEAAIIAAIMALMYFIGITIFPIFTLFFPVPFVVLGIRNNVKVSIGAHIVSCLIMFMLIDPISVLSLFITVGLIGSSFVVMIKSKQSTSNIMMFTSLVTVVAIILMILLASIITGISFKADMQSYLDIMRNDMNHIFSQLPQLTEANIDAKALIEETLSTAAMAIPTAIIVLAMVMTYASYWGALVVLKKLKYIDREIPKFSKFRVPDKIFIVFIALGIVYLITQNMEFINADAIKINMIFIFSFLFLVQGISVLMFKLEKTNTPNPLKWMLAFVLFIASFIHVFIIMIGVTDSIIDLRKIKIRRKED